MAASIETRNLLGSVLAVLLVGIAFAAVLRFMDQTQASTESRGKVNVALQTLELGLSQIKDMETGQRGFLLTGQADYLAPYETERGRASSTISAFTGLEGARQLPPQDMAEFQSLTTAKIDELSETIRLAQAGKRDEALAIVARGDGRRTMDRLRLLHDKLAASLEARRDLDEQRMQASRQQAWRALLLLGSLGLLCIAFSAWVLHRDIQSRTASERALAASDARLHLMVENIRDYAILMLDPEGRISTWNTGAARIKGYGAEEIIGRHFSCFYTPEDAAEGIPERVLQKAREEGRVEEEGWRVRKNGTRFWADVVITTLREEGGRLLGFVKVTRDLTERQRAEEGLRDSERRFRSLAESASDAIISTDARGKIVYWNSAAESIFGHKAEEAIGQAVSLIVPQGFRPAHNAGMARYLATGEAHVIGRIVELEGLHKEGHAFPIELSLSAWEQGTERYFTALIRDTTIRTKLEKESRARETREAVEADRAASYRRLEELNAALDQHAIVAITDALGKITYVNDKFCAISKFAREELLGKDHRIINSGYHPKAFIKGLWNTITSGRVWKGEIKNQAKDGSFYWVDTTIVPFLGTDGEPIQYIAIRADITARKAAEEEIRVLNEELEARVALRTHEIGAVNQELEAFAYSVAHDLRAPLRHIDGFVGLLRRSLSGGVNKAANHHLDVVSASARQMGALIDDLLSFSRMGRAEIHASLLDLGALTRRVIEELAPDAAGRDIEWHIGDLPRIQGDQALLRLALSNLLGNALKFTRGRTPARISISADTLDEAVAVTIRDNGAGFDMRYADKLFGVFQRLHRQDEFEGTGIGLANVARIIQKHGGTVSAEGAVDRGAAFTFTLPALETP